MGSNWSFLGLIRSRMDSQEKFEFNRLTDEYKGQWDSYLAYWTQIKQVASEQLRKKLEKVEFDMMAGLDCKARQALVKTMNNKCIKAEGHQCNDNCAICRNSNCGIVNGSAKERMWIKPDFFDYYNVFLDVFSKELCDAGLTLPKFKCQFLKIL